MEQWAVPRLLWIWGRLIWDLELEPRTQEVCAEVCLVKKEKPWHHFCHNSDSAFMKLKITILLTKTRRL